MRHVVDALHLDSADHGQFHEGGIHNVRLQTFGCPLLVGELHDLNRIAVVKDAADGAGGLCGGGTNGLDTEKQCKENDACSGHKRRFHVRINVEWIGDIRL